MTQNARSTPKWRITGTDGPWSLLLRSALWLAIIFMMIVPLLGIGGR